MSTKIKYMGPSPIEVCVGEFRQSFKPGKATEVPDPRFRMDLLDRDDFITAGKKEKAETGEPDAGDGDADAGNDASGETSDETGGLTENE